MHRSNLLAAGAAAAFALVLAACGGSDDGTEPADLVIKNAYVYTVDANDTLAQAVAVRGGTIVYVGSDGGAQDYVGAATTVVNLGGRMLMPGLVDGHMHPLSGGSATLKCSLDYLSLTIAQMNEKLQACLDATSDQEPGGWLEVVNWDRQAMFSLDRDPTRQDLDALPTTRPVIVMSIDHHSRLVNTRGITLAGITDTTPDPSDGKIVRDANGVATGIFEDGAAFYVDNALPPVTDEGHAEEARVALDLMRRQGVTTFMDALAGETEVKAFATLAQGGELTARAQFALLIDPDEAGDPVAAAAAVKAISRQYSLGAPQPQPGLEVRHVKMFLDGVLQAPAQTAAVLEPYWVDAGGPGAPLWEPGSATGSAYFTQDTLNALTLEVVKAGFDPHMHAIGDAAVRQALDACQYARAQLPGHAFRPAIAHDELVDPADYPRFKALDVTPVMSFQWAQQAPYSLEAVKEQLGPERFARMEPEGSLHDAGARIAYGSDWPVDPMAYFYNLRVGITRSGDPTHPASFGPAYAGRLNDDPLLSRATALRSITMNSAYPLRLDTVVGSIERGKFADLIVLDRNFMTVPEGELAHTQVLVTMVGGEVVWSDGTIDSLASPQATMSGAKNRAYLRNAGVRMGHVHRHTSR